MRSIFFKGPRTISGIRIPARALAVALAVTSSTLGLAASAQTTPAATPASPSGRAISIPMRDGVKLGASLYVPEGKGPFPVVLSISPYGKDRMEHFAGVFIAEGYAVVNVDSRGLRSSGGKWEPYINEARDGFDVQEWIGHQSWSNGNIGMYGTSYPAYTQVSPAPYRSKYVKALVPVSAQSDNYGSVWATDGIFHLAFSPRWAISEQAIAEKRDMPTVDWNKISWMLPLKAIPDALPIKSQFLADVIKNDVYGDFWKAMSIRHKYSEMDTPALHISGWYDDLSNETQLNFIGMSTSSKTEEARRAQRLIIGPWGHGVPKFPTGDWVFGDVNFGQSPRIDINSLQKNWFDHYLKGVANGVTSEAPVRIFVMGENAWRDEQEWPLARAVPTRYYMHSAGLANSRFGNGVLDTTPPGDEPTDVFRYDPRNPVPTHGGHGCCDYDFSSIGPMDQSITEQRPDVLVYTTPALEKDTEVTGFPELSIQFATDVPDTDFFVTLSDVYPDDKSIVITDGEARARFRHGTDQADLLTPNTPDSMTVKLWGTSNLFKKGHRIRVRITSSNFPRFARNLNSGKPAGDETEQDIRVATQTIFHDKTRMTSITLPIIPRN